MITIDCSTFTYHSLNDLKTKIWLQLEIPFSYQILWYDGNQVKDEDFLSIPKDAIFELEVKITRH